VVEAVREILSMNGVGAQPVGRCPFASVVLSTAGDRIRVETTDPNGRKSDRTVATASSAATIVESWLQEDPTALSPRTAGNSDVVATVVVAPIAVEDPPPVEVADPPRPAPVVPAPRAYFDLDGVAGVGFDGSGWFGGGLSGCAALGPVCLGAGSRIGVDPKVGGGSKSLDTQRLLLDIDALLDFPFRLHAVTLRPGIDLGAAFVRMTRTVAGEDEGGDAEEEGEHDDGNSGTWVIQRWEFALGAHLTCAIPLGKRFALTVGAAVLVLPAADTSPFGSEDVPVAGVPRGTVLGSVGLEYAI